MSELKENTEALIEKAKDSIDNFFDRSNSAHEVYNMTIWFNEGSERKMEALLKSADERRIQGVREFEAIDKMAAELRDRRPASVPGTEEKQAPRRY